MRIPVPSFLARGWDRFVAWGDVPVWRNVPRLFLLMAVMFVVCVSWYWHTGGWFSALQGGALYLAITAMALWMF